MIDQACVHGNHGDINTVIKARWNDTAWVSPTLSTTEQREAMLQIWLLSAHSLM